MQMSSIVIISLILGIIAGAAIHEQLIIPVMFCAALLLYVTSGIARRNKHNKSTKSLSKSRNPKQAINPARETHAWPALNQFDFEVVGESYYQPALAKLATDHATTSAGADEIKPLTAHLIPDDYNEYDDKAVRVEINGLHIGYLSREDARSFRRRLGAKKLTGQITTCGAIITGGHIKDGKTMSYGAALDIQPFGD